MTYQDCVKCGTSKPGRLSSDGLVRRGRLVSLNHQLSFERSRIIPPWRITWQGHFGSSRSRIFAKSRAVGADPLEGIGSYELPDEKICQTLATRTRAPLF